MPTDREILDLALSELKQKRDNEAFMCGAGSAFIVALISDWLGVPIDIGVLMLVALGAVGIPVGVFYWRRGNVVVRDFIQKHYDGA